jgi:O-acetyl-ADP-ribose deacetylase (regulator of RNase III)
MDRICDRCTQSRPLEDFEYATRSDKYHATCEGCRKVGLPRTSQGVVGEKGWRYG